MQRTNLDLESYKEKTKENMEKIKLNKQLPYLVGNIVEVASIIIQWVSYLGLLGFLIFYFCEISDLGDEPGRGS